LDGGDGVYFVGGCHGGFACVHIWTLACPFPP